MKQALKVQIRRNVFETNSSSSHSLTVSTGDLVGVPFEADELRDGVIEVSAGEYGWEWRRFYKAKEKIRYLVTQVTKGKVSEAALVENPHVALLATVIREHTGCELKLVPSSGSIDHQSALGEGEVGMELFEDAGRLKQFIFSEDCYLQTGNDNNGAPWEILSDKGRELFYADLFGEVRGDYAAVKLEVLDHGLEALATSSGGLILEQRSPELMSRLLSTGVLRGVEWETTGAYLGGIGNDMRGEAVSRFCSPRGAGGFAVSPDFWVRLDFRKGADAGSQDRFTLIVSVPPELAQELSQLDVKGARTWKVERLSRQYEGALRRAEGKLEGSWEVREAGRLAMALQKMAGKRAVSKVSSKVVEAKAKASSKAENDSSLNGGE